MSHATQLGDRPQLDKLIGPVKVLLDAYAAGKLTAVYLCYTRFINTMRQEPVIQQLLPLTDEQMQMEEGKHGWDYIYEPEAQGRHRRAAGALHRGAGLPGDRREPWPPSSRRGWSR